MASHERPASAGLARQNADVLLTAGALAVPMVVLLAVASFAVAAMVGLHDHLAVTPTSWLHCLEVTGGAASLRAPVLLLVLAVSAVMLQSLLLRRDAFAAGEAREVVVSAIEAVRGSLLRALGAASSPSGASPRSTWRIAEHDVLHGVLCQLRAALALAPAAPPSPRDRVPGLTRARIPSGRRVEVRLAV